MVAFLPAAAHAQSPEPDGPSPASTPALGLVVYGDTRLRSETVSPNALDRDATALTWSARLGLEAALGQTTSALLELEGVADVASEDFPGAATPTIPDRGLLEVNRAQLAKSWDNVQVTLGRQRIELDDERLLGSARFRQAQQTFDAVRAVAQLDNGVRLDGAYVWRVNRPLVQDARSQVFSGNSMLLNASLPTPVGRLTAYAYALDLGSDQNAPSRHSASNLTTGLSLSGRMGTSETTLDWRAEYASQSDYGRNPINYRADFTRLSLAVERGPVQATAQFQELGGGPDQAFQAPLASSHAVLGGADVFLAPPAEGLRATSVGAVWRGDMASPLRNLTAGVSHHWFEPPGSGASLGTEWDFSLSAQLGAYRLSAEYADYGAGAFGLDTRKTWFTIARTF